MRKIKKVVAVILVIGYAIALCSCTAFVATSHRPTKDLTPHAFDHDFDIE